MITGDARRDELGGFLGNSHDGVEFPLPRCLFPCQFFGDSLSYRAGRGGAKQGGKLFRLRNQRGILDVQLTYGAPLVETAWDMVEGREKRKIRPPRPPATPRNSPSPAPARARYRRRVLSR